MTCNPDPKDIYNVDEMLTQILKTSGHMDSLVKRLKEIEGDEAKKLLCLNTSQPFSLSSHVEFKILKTSYYINHQLDCLPHIRCHDDLVKQKATLIGLHDEIAGLKAEYDADKTISDEILSFSWVDWCYRYDYRITSTETPNTEEGKDTPFKVPSSRSCVPSSFVSTEKPQAEVYKSVLVLVTLPLSALMRCSKAAMERKKLTRTRVVLRVPFLLWSSLL